MIGAGCALSSYGEGHFHPVGVLFRRARCPEIARDCPRLPACSSRRPLVAAYVALARFFSLRCAGILTEASRLVLTQLLLKRYRRGALEYSAPHRPPAPDAGAVNTLARALCYHTTHGTEPTLDSIPWRYGAHVGYASSSRSTTSRRSAPPRSSSPPPSPSYPWPTSAARGVS